MACRSAREIPVSGRVRRAEPPPLMRKRTTASGDALAAAEAIALPTGPSTAWPIPKSHDRQRATLVRGTGHGALVGHVVVCAEEDLDLLWKGLHHAAAAEVGGHTQDGC